MKNKPNDREWLQQCLFKIREGDQVAFRQLLEEYEPLISSEVYRCAGAHNVQDREDMRQEACLALYRSAFSYDVEQSAVEFGVFAKICISNALVSHLRVLKRRPGITAVEDIWAQDEEAEDPTRRILEREEAEALNAKLRTLLSPYENRVWALYVAGHSATAIARAMGKDTHSVENAVYRIRQKLRKAFGDESAH